MVEEKKAQYLIDRLSTSTSTKYVPETKPYNAYPPYISTNFTVLQDYESLSYISLPNAATIPSIRNVRMSLLGLLLEKI
jgi:hypothetical protein